MFISVRGGKKVAEKRPYPHTPHIVLRRTELFTATPCYGMHDPWWVVKLLDGHEADPVPMKEDDYWWPLCDMDAKHD